MTSPSNLPYGTSIGTGNNAIAWAEQILADLGAPQTAANINSLVDWFDMEGGGGQNNPLNTTVVDTGSTGAINSVGVQGYATPADGIAATVKTLKQSNFSGILSALKSGKGLIGNTSIASELSSWSGGGYSSISGSSKDTASGNDTSNSSDQLASSLSIKTAGNGIPSWISDVPGLGWLVGTASDVSDIATALQEGVNMFTLLFKPSLWFRVGAFFAGIVLLSLGIYMLAKTADPDLRLPSAPPIPIPVPV